MNLIAEIKTFKPPQKGVFISVIIPTFQTDHFFDECLDTLIKQNFPSDRLEIIIVLNGVKSPYWDNLTQLLQACPIPCKLIFTKTKGVSNARNIGLDYAQGYYILFLDDDDVLSPNYLQELHRHSSADTLSCSNSFNFENSIQLPSVGYIGRAFLKFHSSQPIHNRSFFSTVWGKLIPRKMIGNTRFKTNIRFGEDALFMAQISSRVQNIKLTSASAIYFRRIYSLSSSRLKNSLYTELSNCLKLFANYLFLLISQLGKNQFWFLSLRMLASFKGSSRRIRMAIIQ